MFQFFKRLKQQFAYRAVSAFFVSIIGFSLVFTPSSAAAEGLASLKLPVPGTIVSVSPQFEPVLLKGLVISPKEPLRFDFIIDSGNTAFSQAQVREESQRLIKYFLASLTVPEGDLWVNLSPFETERIIPDELGKTELGRDLLAQDYILKQLTASLMYPEKDLGREFWDRVHKLAQERFGTTNVPVNTFTKVWILPDKATVFEKDNAVYVVESKLKVVLDKDYLALTNNQVKGAFGLNRIDNKDARDVNDVSSQIVREIILPEIEKEVNEGQNFAPLRQVYHSLILAKWYKEALRESVFSQIYFNKNKMAGIDGNDNAVNAQIYARYVEAYKKGAFNYIKEDFDHATRVMTPRKYFSGGISQLMNVELTRTANPDAIQPATGNLFKETINAQPRRENAVIMTGSVVDNAVDIIAQHPYWALVIGVVGTGLAFLVWSEIQQRKEIKESILSGLGLSPKVRSAVDSNWNRLRQAFTEVTITKVTHVITRELSDGADYMQNVNFSETVASREIVYQDRTSRKAPVFESTYTGLPSNFGMMGGGGVSSSSTTEEFEYLTSEEVNVVLMRNFLESLNDQNADREITRQINFPLSLNTMLLARAAFRSDFAGKVLSSGSMDILGIQDAKVRSFLDFLRENELPDIVVVGGAVRDIFWNKASKDIDITVKVNMTSEERERSQFVGAQASMSMYEQTMASLQKLALVLGVPVESFFAKDSVPDFNGIKIHFVGPKRLSNEVILQGLVVDRELGNVRASYTAPGLLQMAIDSSGVMYGYRKPLNDALNGVVQLQGDLQSGRNLSVLGVIKWLRLKHEFGLTLTVEDYGLVNRALSEIKVADQDILQIHESMQELLDETSDRKAALDELNQLGLIEKVRFVPRTTMTLNQFFLSWGRVAAKTFNTTSVYSFTPFFGQAGIEGNAEQWVSEHKWYLVFGAIGAMVIVGVASHWWENNTLSGVLSTDRYGRVDRLQKLLTKRDFKYVVGLLTHSEQDVRSAAMRVLAETGNKLAIEPIVYAKVNNESVLALEKLGASSDQLFKVHLQLIRDYSPTSWGSTSPEKSIEFVVKTGNSVAIEPLLGIVRSGSVTSSVLTSLKKLNVDSEVYFQALLEGIRVKQDSWILITELGNRGDKRAIDSLLNIVANPTLGINSYVVEALIKLGVTNNELLSRYKTLLFSTSIARRLEASSSILKLGNYEHADILRRMVERQPSDSPIGNILSFLEDAIQWKSEGYDFKVVYSKETGHDEVDNSTQYTYYNYVMDTPEILRIERGERLSDASIAQNKDNQDLGGIDMNRIDLERQAGGERIAFDEAALEELLRNGVDGFAPIIIEIAPITSPLPVLGLAESGTQISSI